MLHSDPRYRKPIANVLLCILIVLASWTIGGSARAQAVIWQQFLYGAPGIGLNTRPYQHAFDSNNNPIIAGSVYVAATGSEWHVLKLSTADGTELWRYRLVDIYAAAGSIAVDADNNVYALGSFSGGVRLLKLDGVSGTVIWQQDFNRSTYAGGRAGAYDSAGGLVLDQLGNVYISTTSFRSTIGYTGVVAKYDAGTGAPIWDKDLGTMESSGGPMVTDAQGDVFITSSYRDTSNYPNWETKKLSRVTGAELWRTTFDGTAHYYDYPLDIAIDASGNVVVTGDTNQPPNGTSLSEISAKTIKYDGTDGHVIWETGYANFRYTSQLKIDAAGDVIVVGTTSNTNFGNVAKILKHAGATGNTLWESPNGPNSNDTAGINSVAIDANGQLVTAGWLSGQGYSLVVRRFNASTGARTGEASYGILSGDPNVGIAVRGAYSYLVSTGRDAAQSFAGLVIKVHNAPAVPSIPRGLIGIPGSGNLSLVFSPPASNGGSQITSYQARCMPGNIFVIAASTPIRISGLANSTSYECTVAATNALGVGDSSPTVTVIPASSAPVALIGVSSRKAHGSMGDFDLQVDNVQSINGVITIEPRTNSGGHRIVFVFNDTVANGDVAVTDALGMNFSGLSVIPSYVGNELTASITGLADNVRILVSATQVNGALNVSRPIGFLLGDVNGSGRVTASDIAAIKARGGSNIAIGNNFLYDINLSGQVNANDLSQAKVQAGRSLH